MPQVDAEDAFTFRFDKVRRPVAEDKAIAAAVQLIKVLVTAL